MRARFFLFILIVFLFTVLTFGIAQYFIVRQESLRLVDQQIEEMISALYSSKLSSKEIQDVVEARAIVHEVLGDDRLNAVISIYSPDGKPVFQNHHAAAGNMRLSILSGRELIETRRGHVIRLATVPLRGGKQYLQAGVILDDIIVRWRILGLRLLGYLVVVFFLIALISYYLSHLLLRPIESFAQYLQHRVDRFDISETLNPTWSHLAFVRWKSDDEIGRLIRVTQLLLAKVRETVEMNRARAALLAHELKTPLTIIKNRLENISRHTRGAPATLASEAMEEVDNLGKLITAFTQWSLFCSEPGSAGAIHALKLSEIIDELTQKLDAIYPGRLSFDQQGEQMVFADPEHVKNAISNLILNALKYSGPSSMVYISLKEGLLQIRDGGPGFPDFVLEKLGSPFNVGTSKERHSGTGLGLAWVSAICRRYGWLLKIHSVKQGSVVEIAFPPAPE